MAGAFDATLKQLLDTCASDWLSWLAPLVGLPTSVQARPLDADLSTVQPAADKVFELLSPLSGLLHLEPQSSWDGGLMDRLLLYSVLLEHRYKKSVYTIALLLRPEANAANLTGELVRQHPNGKEYHRFYYTVVRVWDLSADTLMSGGLGAAALALLTNDAQGRLPELVNRFTQRVDREASGTDAANLLLSCAYILLGLRYDEATTRVLFRGVQQMRESSTYQAILAEGRNEGIAQGMAQGASAEAQRLVLRLGGRRFGAPSAETELAVRAISDRDRLERLAERVLDATGWDDLLATL